MLMSELAHLKKLYNDIIYFVQNHVKPVAPSNSFSSSFLLPNTCSLSPPSPMPPAATNASMVQRQMNQLLGYYSASANPKQTTPQVSRFVRSPTTYTSKSSVSIVEESCSNNTKLFGVSLQSKKRMHPDSDSIAANSEMNKARLVLEKDDDLALNLMPPSAC